MQVLSSSSNNFLGNNIFFVFRYKEHTLVFKTHIASLVEIVHGKDKDLINLEGSVLSFSKGKH